MYPPEEDAALRNNRGDLPWDVTGKVNDKEFPLMETARPLVCLLYTSPSPRDVEESRMPSSA